MGKEFGPMQNNAFVVKTRNSTYRLGEPDADGKRSVSRDEKGLTSKACKILHLEEGVPMRLAMLDPPAKDSLHSSPVQSVEVS